MFEDSNFISFITMLVITKIGMIYTKSLFIITF